MDTHMKATILSCVELATSSPPVELLSNATIHKDVRHGKPEVERWYLDEVKHMTDDEFRSHFRMTREAAMDLSERLEIKMHQQSRIDGFSQCLVALWYLANQGSYRVVGEQFSLSKSTVHEIVTIFCKRVIQKQRETVKLSETAIRDSRIPGVIGFIDGTHIKIKKPRKDMEPDVFINRKGVWSVNVLAVCDDNERYMFYSIGAFGSAHDSRVLRSTDLPELLDALPDGICILGDSGYGNTTRVITPYPNPTTLDEMEFNKLHKKMRVRVENSFARLKGKWRRLHFLDVNSVEKANEIIETCMLLHNYVLETGDSSLEVFDSD